MSTSIPQVEALKAVGSALREELQAARERARSQAQRRMEAERNLAVARAAEAAAMDHVRALEAVAARAPGLVEDVVDLDLASEGEPVDHKQELKRLRGAQLREMSVRVALRHGAISDRVHWRQWYDWLREAGYDASGKKPAATFLTQLARSPLVRRTTDDGIYMVDLRRIRASEQQLATLHAEIADLPPSGQTSLLGTLDDVRRRRRALQTQTGMIERGLAEMLRVLSLEAPPWAPRTHGQHAVDAWLAGPDAAAVLHPELISP